MVAALVALTVAVETLVFNFASLESLVFPHVSPKAVGGSASGEAEFSFDSEDVRGIRLSSPDGGGFTFSVYLRDEGNSLFYLAGTGASEDGEAWVRIHPAGLVSAVKVEFSRADGSLSGLDVSFNGRVPFRPSALRILLLGGSMLLVHLAYGGLGLGGSPVRRKHVAAIAACGAIAAASLTFYAAPSSPSQAPSEHQYFELAKSLSQGKVYLDYEASDGLASLDNPYDTALREEMGVDYLWDHAYRDGRYYVYFGVLPALIYHLPWYLATGQELPNWVGVAASSALFAAGSAFLVEAVFRWCGRTPTVSWFLGLYSGFMLASGVSGACAGPDLYSLPISTALALLAWGLACWLTAVTPVGDRAGVRVGWGLAGSLLMALIALCRPQLLLLCLLGIPLVAPALKGGPARKAAVLAVCLAPFAAVALLAGAYNAARFGSPLDFGANYNLTSNDMTHRGWNADRTASGLLSYLLQPPSFVLSPFGAAEAYPILSYFGTSITGVLPGGILVCSPVLLLAVPWLLSPVRGSRRARRAGMCAALSAAVGVAVAAIDANVAGVLARYYMDFGPALALSMVFAAARSYDERLELAPAAAISDRELSLRAQGRLLLAASLAVTLLFACLWIWFKLHA